MGIVASASKEAVYCKWAAVHCGSYSHADRLLTSALISAKWLVITDVISGHIQMDKYINGAQVDDRQQIDVWRRQVAWVAGYVGNDRRKDGLQIKHWKKHTNSESQTHVRHTTCTAKADKSIRWIDTRMLAVERWILDLTVNISLPAEPTSQGEKRPKM